MFGDVVVWLGEMNTVMQAESYVLRNVIFEYGVMGRSRVRQRLHLSGRGVYAV